MHRSFTRRKNIIPRRIFLEQLAEDLSGPHIDERSNSKKRWLQKGTFDEEHDKMTKYCQVKGESKKNRAATTSVANHCAESVLLKPYVCV